MTGGISRKTRFIHSAGRQGGVVWLFIVATSDGIVFGVRYLRMFPDAKRFCPYSCSMDETVAAVS